MLEGETGPIGEHANICSQSVCHRDIESGPPEFVGFVETLHRRLQTALGDDAYVWAGAAVDINPLAERLLTDLQRDFWGPSPTERHRFSAATGVSLPYLSNMAPVLEDFIRSGKGAADQAGQRTFFGHRVP